MDPDKKNEAGSALAPDNDAPAAVPPEGSGDEPFVLTPENYYTGQANRLYLSNSLFKAVYGSPADPYPCEAAALFAPDERTEALVAGGYVDAAFESDQALKDFVDRNRSELMLKSGKGFYKFVTDADQAIARAKMDPVFMSYLDGQHQAVMTGTIAGQPFKIKMDDYKPGERITDLKYVKSSAEAFNEFLRRRVTFVENYGYDIQGAIYQEIEYQNSGMRLPFYIAYITKEGVPDFGVVQVPQEMLDEALEYVKLSLAARPMADVRKAPRPCGRRSCAWCRGQKSLNGPMSWDEFVAYAQT